MMSLTPAAGMAVTVRCRPCVTVKPWLGACVATSPSPRAMPTPALARQEKPPAANAKHSPQWAAKAARKPHNAGKQTPAVNTRKHSEKNWVAVETGFVAPRARTYVIPPASVDQLVLVGTDNVFSQSIVIGVANCPSRSGNPVLGKTLVVDNADVLRAVIRMVNETCRFLSTHDRLVESLSGNASVRMESDNAHPTIRRGVNVGDKRGIHKTWDTSVLWYVGLAASSFD